MRTILALNIPLLSFSLANSIIEKIDFDSLGDTYIFGVSADDIVTIDLGTLTTGKLEFSIAKGVSADGSVIVGQSDHNDSDYRAFKYSDDTGLIDLGTLTTDKSGNSYANGVSADGTVIVGMADNDDGYERAFKYSDDTGMIDLGTFTSDKSGDSYANGVSADGSVIVGEAYNDESEYRAFKYSDDTGMIDLGTLKTDKSGSSSANGVSADGSVIVGTAANDYSKYRAFKYSDDTGMIDLGTLTTDKSGDSFARAVSADGSVIVGQANNDYTYRAFKYSDDTGMIDLGTLKTNQLGWSSARAVSADGSVIVGQSNNDDGYDRAFKYSDDTGMIDLGTLKTDQSGASDAYGVSADGSVIVGHAENDDGVTHATVWKIIPNADPVDPPSIVIVDATNSNKTMLDAAHKTYQVLDLYRSRLISLSGAECSLGDNNYCVGIFANFDSVKNNHTFATGIFGAVRINQQLSAGLSIDYLADSSLPSGFKTRGSSTPGLGGFIKFQQNPDQSGFNLKLSGAFQEDKISITRQQLNMTEAGMGDTKIKSKLLKLGTAYGIELSEKVMIFPNVGIIYTEVSRDAYTENRNAHFPASFGKASDKRTSLELGVKANYALSKIFSIYGNVGVYINLDHKRDNFTGNINYIGAHVYDFGDEKKVQPYVSLGVQTGFSNNSAISLNTRWSKQTYNNDSFNVGLSYSYRF